MLNGNYLTVRAVPVRPENFGGPGARPARPARAGNQPIAEAASLGDIAAQATLVSGHWPGAPAAGQPIPEAGHRFDIRLPPDTPWGRAELGEPYEITGWIRFADDTEADTTSLVLFADAFPPTVIGSMEVGWVPTLELTVHVRHRPAPGWLLGTFRTRLLIDGVLEEDGELWDSEGHPVAQSRQLALILEPRRP